MDWDELLDPLSPLYQETMQEQIKIVNMQDGLIAAARQLAEEHYPVINNMEAKFHKELNSVIIKHAVKMAIDINSAIYGRDADDYL
ncbi:hypothetical protein CLV51_1011303 [Chitinophaga niastensis]|uniref:Uncharacterized protein n=1 Tax=Chitinophaga niastensis TaxID=536980 RepID=A0A2P8HUQ9_CHINA|nr:hypothetical protein [Chitinophaga niastensis]PSL49961.1 hypothetical protein CLV51_1011303 [Chitinophaga niastensis]